MNIKLQKFIGWILLLLGILIILWVLYSSYNIFHAKTPPPEVFKVIKKETILPKKGITDLETKTQEMIREQLKELIPAENLFTLLNLFSWSIFTGILIFAGGQISSLGIKLLKK